jgi:hypothetical protein
MVVSFSSRIFWMFPGAGLLTVTGLPTSLHFVLVTIYLVMVSMMCLVTESGYRFLSHSSLSGGCPSVAICWEDRESDNTARYRTNGSTVWGLSSSIGCQRAIPICTIGMMPETPGFYQRSGPIWDQYSVNALVWGTGRTFVAFR